MNDNNKRIRASFQLFNRLNCCLVDLNGDFDNDTAHALMEVYQMRCLILNYIAGLNERKEMKGVKEMAQKLLSMN
jgi:hypothetical protein